MGLDKAELEQLLEFAVGLAHEAGEITLKYFRGAHGAELKTDGSFVTAADREAEAHIRARLAEKFPDDAVVGEEAGESEGTSGRQWIVDPIDGTYSFVHGVPLYGVMLGLEVEGEMAVGVVNLPAMGERVSAARGLGCHWNNQRARVSETAQLDGALLLSTDFGLCERYGKGAACEKLERVAGARRTWGDCYGHVLVATGRADVMLDPVMNVWDCAALLPIIEEAGGHFTDWRGRRTIRGGDAISTNARLFDQVMKTVMSTE
ncbi:MAG TPA: histidinol-phosphatase [Pyrinomonadaceae bacterium]|nr:histidinol-phosphatase [Pyrinomonadaceae bacterium]